MNIQFDVERDMWIPAVKWLCDLGCEVKREFRTPWGICDLVGLQWARDRVHHRQQRKQFKQIGPVSRIAVLQAIPDEASGNSITPAEICAQIAEPLAFVEKELKALLGGRFINRLDNGTLTSAGDSSGWA